MFGYFGGINIAILLIAIQQNHPNASVCQLIQLFFDVYSCTLGDTPIQLTEVPNRPDLHFDEYMWRNNPKSESDVLAILTPVYPCTNSTHSVYQSTLCHIQTQLRFAADCFRRVCASDEVTSRHAPHR